MRSYILVILSAICLGGVFVCVWTMQSASSKPLKEQAHITPPQLKRVKGYGPIKPGDIVWIKQYDRLGQLSSRFSGDEFLPQPDGTVNVTKPRADFFLANHQRLQVDGVDGNVVMKDVPSLSPGIGSSNGPPGPPSRGRLNHVVVRLMDDEKHVELLHMTTNNVVFDNETFLISTHEYRDEHGNDIPDDMVPVHVTGQMTMKGKGLTVRWNDKDGRLDLLQIAHGDVLIINDPSSFSLNGSKAPAAKQSPVAQVFGPLPEMIADSSNDAVGQILTHHPAPPKAPDNGGLTARPSKAPIYQASFFDNVRVTQAKPNGTGDQVQIDQVDRMDVDFLMKQTEPAAAPQPAATQRAATPIAAAASIPAATQPGTVPTSAAPQKEPPIVVHWTGPLRVTPVTLAPPPPMQPTPLLPGDSMVFLTGHPVKVHRVDPNGLGTQDIASAYVLYATDGQKVWLDRSQEYPQIKIDKTPAPGAKEQGDTHVWSAGKVQYSRLEGTANFTGPGSAEVPLESDPKTPHPVMKASWARQAIFDFTPDVAGEQPVITAGHFEGDVNIRHPKLTLQSQQLDLAFDAPIKSLGVAATQPSSSQPNLHQMTATTAVHCEVEGRDAKVEKINSDRLVLTTARMNDKLYARQIDAIGHVHARGDDDLQAGTVKLWLKPATKNPSTAPAVKDEDEASQMELEKMIALDDVIATSKDGSKATGDRLVVTMVDGKQHAVLTSPTNATVTNVKGDIVRGPEIQFDSSDGRAHVVGPGSLHAIQQASTTQPAVPVNVTWTHGAAFDGVANHVDVDGSVRAESVDKRGFTDIATGHHIHIDLRPKPTTQPAAIAAEQSATSSSSATTSAEAKMDPFKGKDVAAMTIEGDAKVTSTLNDSTGGILEQTELEGPKIIVTNDVAADGTPARGVTVPAAGEMLYRDHRPKSDKPAAGNDSAGGGARGATAFRWTEKMLYREATQRADMIGNVHIVHQDDDPTSPRVTMVGQHVIAWFEPSAKRSEGKKSDDDAGLHLKKLTALGDAVDVRRDTDEVIARQFDYYPLTHMLVATGTEQNPVAFNNSGAMSGIADRLEWDTISWKMNAQNAIFDDRPAVPGAMPPSKSKKKPATGSKQ